MTSAEYTATLSNTFAAEHGRTRFKEFLTIPFPYVEPEHIKVFVDGVETTNFELHTPTTLKLNETFPVNELPVTVRIERVTTLEKLTKFSPGTSIRAEDLNKNFEAVVLRFEELSNP